MNQVDYLRGRLFESGLDLIRNTLNRTYKVYNPLVYPPDSIATISEEALPLMSKEEIDLFVLDLLLKTTFES